MAVEVPVRGIAVYGTASGTWFEGVFGQRRRLASLDGTDPAEVDREILGQARFWYPLSVEKKTPREIREQDPGCPRRVWDSGSRTTSMWRTATTRSTTRSPTRTWPRPGRKVAATPSSVGAAVPAPGGPRGRSSPRVLAIWGALGLARRSGRPTPGSRRSSTGRSPATGPSSRWTRSTTSSSTPPRRRRATDSSSRLKGRPAGGVQPRHPGDASQVAGRDCGASRGTPGGSPTAPRRRPLFRPGRVHPRGHGEMGGSRARHRGRQG